MTALKSARTLAASLGVLAFGALAATPAMAYDNIEWNWKNDTKQYTDIDVYIDVDVESTGLVQVEKLQIFLGDVTATNTVAHIYNEPFYQGADDHKGGGGYDPWQGKKNSKPSYDKGGDYYQYDPKKDYGHKPKRPEVIVCFRSPCGGGNDWDKGGDWEKIPVKPLDARVELPIIQASAQAIGNNQSITTDTPVFLHDAQFVADVKEYDRYRKPNGEWDTNSLASAMPESSNYRNKCWDKCGPQGPDGNLHTDLAGLFLLGSVFHVFKHADISASSSVYDVKNVSVANSSTAVANNISVDLASDVDGGSSCNTGCKDRLSNHVVLADITQFALANVTATTTTKHVTATGYDHMRQLETDVLSQREGDPGYTISVPTPWISSTATAVGNSVSINVGRDLTPTPKTSMGGY
jgi:hypothetical protein